MSAFTQEVANARIWAGFHYRFSTRVGTDMGLKISDAAGRDGFALSEWPAEAPKTQISKLNLKCLRSQ